EGGGGGGLGGGWLPGGTRGRPGGGGGWGRRCCGGGTVGRRSWGLALGRLEEREGRGLLALAEDVQREGVGLLDHRVGVGIGLDADRDEGRGERRLGHPVHRGRRGARRALGGQDVQAVGNHAERGLLGVGIHAETLL